MNAIAERRLTRESAEGAARPTTRQRLATVALAVLAPTIVWLVAELAGTDVQSPAFQSSPPFEIGVGNVMVTATAAALAAWGLLVLLEHFTRSARRVWTTIAIALLLVSLAGPLSGTGISTGNRLILAVMHLTVGAFLIPLLGRTAPSQRTRQR